MHPQTALKTALPDTRGTSQTTPAERIAGVALIALFTFFFYSLWWNRFLGGNGVDGCYYFAGKQILSGRIPYRDYLFAVTPLDALFDAFLIRVFGDYVILPRLLGLIGRLVLVSVMFVWLRRLFRPAAAFVGVLVGIVVFSASGADPVAGYNHNASLWAVLAGYGASLTIEREDRRQWVFAGLSGFCAGLSFLTKQTVGAGVTAAIATVLLLTLLRSNWRDAILRTVAFVAGWAVPTGIFAAWLMNGGAWGRFIDEVFISGPSSKGSLVQVFTRPLSVAIHDAWLRQELAAAILLMVAIGIITRRPAKSSPVSSWRGLVLITVAGFLTVLIARAMAATGVGGYARLSSPHRILMFVSVFGSVVITAWYFALWARGPMTARQNQIFLLAGVSAAVAYMHSLSFVVTESMTIPALPFLIAWPMDRLGSSTLHRLCRGAILAGGFAVVLTAATFKLNAPFNWYGWKEGPVQASVEASTVPQLAGLRMSHESREFIERLTYDVKQNLKSPSSEYAFFYLPLAYALTDGYPPTTAFLHFIDVAPDDVARRDAAVLRQARPSVIVYTPLEPGEIVNWEHDFRASHPSGQRELIATLEELIASDYRQVDTLHMPGSERPVIVYARKQ